MSKKFGLFGDKDLFLVKNLKPLTNQLMMRKFEGSKIIMLSALIYSLSLSYWYDWIYLGCIKIIEEKW